MRLEPFELIPHLSLYKYTAEWTLALGTNGSLPGQSDLHPTTTSLSVKKPTYYVDSLQRNKYIKNSCGFSYNPKVSVQYYTVLK